MPFEPSSIRGIRGMLGMNQATFGKEVGGFSATTVHNWEHSNTQPDFNTVDNIYKLCERHNFTDVPNIYRPPSPFILR